MSGFYILILFFLLLCLVSKNNKIIFSIGVLVLILFGGLRYPLDYSDNENYLYFFKYNVLPYVTTENFNIGYVVLNKVFAKYIPNFQMFVFLISTIIALMHAFFIKKYSRNAILSLFLFVLVGYFWSFITIRQYLAISISLIAFHYLLNKKLVYFILYTILATSFHTTAFIIFPVYFIYWLKMNTPQKFLLLFGFIALIIFFRILASIFLSGTYYEIYLESDQTSSIQRLIMKAYIFLVFVLIFKEKVFEKNINFLIFLSFLFTIAIYIGGNGIFGVYRLREYFEIGEFIGIPIMFDAINNKSIKAKLVYRGMLLFYILLLMIACYNSLSMDGFPNDYRFFWTIY